MSENNRGNQKKWAGQDNRRSDRRTSGGQGKMFEKSTERNQEQNPDKRTVRNQIKTSVKKSDRNQEQTSFKRADRSQEQTSFKRADRSQEQTSFKRADRSQEQTSFKRADRRHEQTSDKRTDRTKEQTSINRTERTKEQTSVNRTERSQKQAPINIGKTEIKKQNGPVDKVKRPSSQEDFFEDLDYRLLSQEEKEKYGFKSNNANKSYGRNNIKQNENSKSRFGRNSKDSKPEYNKNTYNPTGKEAKTGKDPITGKGPVTGKGSITGKGSKAGSCPYIRECGGCNILQQSYEEELKVKQKLVDKLLNKYCKVEPVIGMKNPKNYRNKVHVVFDHDRKGNPISGVYEEGTHRVVPVDRCLIHNEKADAIIETIRDLLKSFKIKTYDEDTGYGLLRHVLIRTGYVSGEIMVVLVLASPILPSKNNFVKALRLKHPEITTVVLNVNDKRTSMVLGDKEQVIYGKGYIEDSLCGKVFRISPKSFYQVNPAQTEVLYGKAIEMAGLTGKETVIDAYCGTGTIGIIASDRAKKVIGIELNQDAVRDANMNAKRNDIHNIEFYHNDAGVFMSQMAAQKDSVDVVLMDPPRSGSSEQFLDAVAQLKPKKVVYISCNPLTLERDLTYITKKGYKVERCVPVDMFPWTGHVECCVLLKKIEK